MKTKDAQQNESKDESIIIYKKKLRWNNVARQKKSIEKIGVKDREQKNKNQGDLHKKSVWWEPTWRSGLDGQVVGVEGDDSDGSGRRGGRGDDGGRGGSRARRREGHVFILFHLPDLQPVRNQHLNFRRSSPTHLLATSHLLVSYGHILSYSNSVTTAMFASCSHLPVSEGNLPQ